MTDRPTMEDKQEGLRETVALSVLFGEGRDGGFVFPFYEPRNTLNTRKCECEHLFVYFVSFVV